MLTVQPELIRSIGNQLENIDYLTEVEKEMWAENPALANIANQSVSVLDQIITDSGNLMSAKTVCHAVYLLTYQAIKQQMICEELK